MTENIVDEKKAIPPTPKAEDLSKEIENAMERRPHEQIRVVRVFENCYRCNWWAPDKSPQSFWLGSGTIRKSQFIKATKTNDRLLITDATIVPAE
jgi:hypothetical protein